MLRIRVELVLLFLFGAVWISNVFQDSGVFMSFSQDFLEKLLLLVFTAVLSGLLVPYFLKQVDAQKLRDQKAIDERKNREQKEFESDLVRQSKVIEAQAQLLENLAKQLWEFHLLHIAVSYYKINLDENKYQSAVEEYDEKSWTYFGTIRTEISKALYLTSIETYDALLHHYTKELIPLDSSLMHLIRGNVAHENWTVHHNHVQGSMGNKTDQALGLLAEELRLSKKSVTR
jgi:hypothetical protein